MARLAIRATGDRSKRESITTGDRYVRAEVHLHNRRERRDPITVGAHVAEDGTVHWMVSRPTDDGHAVLASGKYKA